MKCLSLHRQEDGCTTANARSILTEEPVGASSPQPILPRRAERALALPAACHADGVPPYQEQQPNQVSTVSGQGFWCDNHFRNKGTSVYRTRNKVIDWQPTLGIKTKNVNPVRNNKQNCQPKSVHSNVSTWFHCSENCLIILKFILYSTIFINPEPFISNFSGGWTPKNNSYCETRWPKTAFYWFATISFTTK